MPWLRGYGTTRFLSGATPRTGQQSVLAVDTTALMDALDIETAVIGGFDWGPDGRRYRRPLARPVQGAGVGQRLPHRRPQAGQDPLLPEAEHSWWYQFYFATERGRAGYDRYRREFARLIWQSASPKWVFDESTFDQSAGAFDNPDHVDIVIHNYRWRLGLAAGDAQYDDLERRLSGSPVITVPAITLEGDANGAPHPDPGSYREKFSAGTSTGPSPAASGTTCRKRLRRRSPKPSSTPTASDR